MRQSDDGGERKKKKQKVRGILQKNGSKGIL